MIRFVDNFAFGILATLRASSGTQSLRAVHLS